MRTKRMIEPISSVFVNLVNVNFTAKQKGLQISKEWTLEDGLLKGPIDFIQVQIANV